MVLPKKERYTSPKKTLLFPNKEGDWRLPGCAGYDDKIKNSSITSQQLHKAHLEYSTKWMWRERSEEILAHAGD